MKKYKLTERSKVIDGHILYQIEAIEKFDCNNPNRISWEVTVGELGGWIEDESNLSQEDGCWITQSCKVYGGARVFGNACLNDNSTVKDKSIVCGSTFCSGCNIINGAIVDDNQAHCEITIKGDKQPDDECDVKIAVLVNGVKKLTTDERMLFYKKLMSEDLL